MDDSKVQSKELKNAGYEIFVGVLSILSIVNIVLALLAEDPNLETVLHIMNGLFSIIFLGDFAYRLFTAESKSRYFFRQFGWADLLASLPFEGAKILRVFRLVRVIRLLRDYGVKNIGRGLVRDRAGSALLTLLLMGILVLEFGSLEILYLEQYAPEANITSASDALWYVIVTISTVGYGDHFPVTNGGRIFGALIIIIGVGIFGTFTGYLANVFLSPSKKTPDASTSDGDVQTKVRQLQALMAQQQATIDEIDLGLQTDDGN
jgi:voltage-gated potassium channel